MAVSARVRLARNLAGYTFPGRAETALRQDVFHAVCAAQPKLAELQPGYCFSVSALRPRERQLLQERCLISTELARAEAGSGVLVKADQSVSIMINEEDHLRVHAVVAGLDLAEAWRRVRAVDVTLNQVFELAFDRELGFLTACPSNVGTGLRASAMMHVAGLILDGSMKPVIKAAAQLGFAVRGAFGEGSDPAAGLIQVSNQSTLGETEGEILRRLEHFIRQVARHERCARLRLVRKHRARLYDYVGRAYGILSQARLLTSQEALSHLCALKLGVELGLFRALAREQVQEWILTTQPGHLQNRVGRDLEDSDRDACRAEFLRAQLRSDP